LLTVTAGDPLEADVGAATVVCLVLGERNRDMLQALRRQLQPGARIVTHQGGVFDWQPQEETSVSDADGRSYHLCLWQVPKRGGPGSSLGGIGDSAWESDS
jgi:hypothetical protein